MTGCEVNWGKFLKTLTNEKPLKVRTESWIISSTMVQLAGRFCRYLSDEK